MTSQKTRISFWQRLFDMVCPKACGVCGRRLGLNEEVLCGTCNLHLARTGHASHPTDNEMAKAFWGRISIEKAAALFHYQPQSQTARLIYNLKYHGHEDFGERMGEMTAREFDEKGFFDHAAREQLLSELGNKSAVVIGCGIGTGLGAQAVLETVLKRCKGTVLVDADGINLLAQNIYLLEERKETTVLTPHLGEFSALIDKPIEDIKRNRKKYAKMFCERFPHAVLVLKGKGTIIAKKGEMLYINPTGNAGLAQGGTGDVLAGLIGGLLAQGISPVQSAVIGAFVHGTAGDICAEQYTQRGMSTADVIACLPASWKKLEG